MTIYFDFTPYVTDTPISIRIQNTCFTTFLCKQFDEQQIPYTCVDHEKMIQPGQSFRNVYIDPIYVTTDSTITVSLTVDIMNILNKCGNYDNTIRNSPIYKAFDQNRKDDAEEIRNRM